MDPRLRGAAAGRIDAWYSPSNILPLGLPRPKVVTIHDANLFDPAGLRPRLRQGRRAAVPAIGPRGADRPHRFGIRPLRDRRPARRRSLDDRGCLSGDRPHVRGTPHDLIPASRATPSSWDGPSRTRTWASSSKRGGGHPRVSSPGRSGAAGHDDAAIRRGGRVAGRASDPPPGAVSEGRLAQLYRDATCFLFPSRMEGFGLPPLEAMRLGIPTAVAAATCLPEVTAGAALLFDPDDPDSVVAAIGDLLSPAATDRLRREGPAVAARYRWAPTSRDRCTRDPCSSRRLIYLAARWPPRDHSSRTTAGLSRRADRDSENCSVAWRMGATRPGGRGGCHRSRDSPCGCWPDAAERGRHWPRLGSARDHGARRRCPALVLFLPLHPFAMRVAAVDLGFTGRDLVLLSAWKEIALGAVLLSLVVGLARSHGRGRSIMSRCGWPRRTGRRQRSLPSSPWPWSRSHP